MLWQRAALVVVAVILFVALSFKAGRHGGNSSTMTAFSVSDRPAAWLQVRGDVRHAGIYPLSDKSMTIDVIKMAEPLCDLSEMSGGGSNSPNLYLNSAVVIDCNSSKQHVKITVGVIPPMQCLLLGIPFSINRATAGDLDLVPGIGPVLAERIVCYRQKNGDFSAIEQLLQVEGIGFAKLDILKKFVIP